MARLFLQLLGRPRLVSPDGTILLKGGIPLSLLAYLLLEDRPISREHLAELFWPGSDRSHRLHNLRQSFLRIRNNLPEDLIQGDGVVSLQREGIRCDVLEFRENLAEGRIREALDLWQGAFMEGVRRSESWELEDWLEKHRSFLEETLAKGTAGEARRLLSSGRPGDALPILKKARGILPFHDGLGALEVVALAAMGRIAEAEGVSKTLEMGEDSESARMVREALSRAAEEEEPVSETGEPPPSSGPEPVRSAQTPGPGPHAPRRRFPRSGQAVAWMVAVAVLLSLIALSMRGGESEGGTQLASGEADQVILFCAGWATRDQYQQLYRMNLDGNGKHRMSEAPLCESAWVPEVGALFGPVPFGADTARLMRLTPNPDNPRGPWAAREVEAARSLREIQISRTNPKVGPNGTLVFWAKDQAGNADIYALDGKTGALRRLTTDPAEDMWPTVAPGSDRVVFTSFRSGGGDLYSVRLDGTGLQRLTTDPRRDGHSWIRGDSVLFDRGLGVEGATGDLELVLLDLQTNTETYLTDNDWNDYEAAWSPDGRYICWQSERLGHYESDVMVMDLKEGRSWDLTNRPGRESDCRWMPESDGVVYIQWAGEGVSDLYRKGIHGGDAENLTRYPGLESPSEVVRLPDFMRRDSPDSSLQPAG